MRLRVLKTKELKYSIQNKEGYQKGIERIISQCHKITLVHLSRKKDIHHHIHQARRHLKILRSALRIIRFDIPPSEFRSENKFYRDIGRNLSKARDLTALMETITNLVPPKAKTHKRDILSQLKNEVYLARQKLITENRHFTSEIVQRMRHHPLILNNLTWESNYPDHLTKALAKSYDLALESHQICLKKIADEDIHEYRKRAKYIRYQLLILQDIWPPMFLLLEHEFHQLTDFLGQANNLTILQNFIEESSIIKNGELEKVKSRIEKNKLSLANLALESGKRLFAENTNEFEKRIQTYVKYWTAL